MIILIDIIQKNNKKDSDSVVSTKFLSNQLTKFH